MLEFDLSQDFHQLDNVYIDGDYSGQKTARSLSGTVEKAHNGMEVGCYVKYEDNYVNDLNKTYTLNVTCEYSYFCL